MVRYWLLSKERNDIKQAFWIPYIKLLGFGFYPSAIVSSNFGLNLTR